MESESAAQRKVDGIFAIHSGKQPSILASTSVEEGQPERLWNGGGDILPRMDGGETWREARICGTRAMYSGLVLSILANMAPPKVLVIWVKINYCIYTQ